MITISEAKSAARRENQMNKKTALAMGLIGLSALMAILAYKSLEQVGTWTIGDPFDVDMDDEDAEF